MWRPRSPSNVAVTNREFLREEDVGGEVSRIGLPSEVQRRGSVSGPAAVAILFASEAADRERDREQGERQAWTRHDSRLDPETQSRFQRLEHPEHPEHLSQPIQNRQPLMRALEILRQEVEILHRRAYLRMAQDDREPHDVAAVSEVLGCHHEHSGLWH
jgi:hypothetical protein